MPDVSRAPLVRRSGSGYKQASGSAQAGAHDAGADRAQPCVYLVQRATDVAKMAGMWELPECAEQGTKQSAGRKELCVVRHSITDTDYEVRVVSGTVKTLGAAGGKAGRWVERAEIFAFPLTGLTRKILRRQMKGLDGRQ